MDEQTKTTAPATKVAAKRPFTPRTDGSAAKRPYTPRPFVAGAAGTGPKRPFTPRTGGAPTGGGYKGTRPAGLGGYKKKIGGPGGRDNRGGKGGRFGDKPKPEFDQKMIQIRRVTRVVAGGRRFAFSVVLAIGDKKGSLGIGIGKAQDTSLAIQKALNKAKKNLLRLKLTKDHSIPHGMDAKFSSAIITVRPNFGRGIVAGSAIRTLLELGGVKDVTVKVLSRSKNKLNNAEALIKALTPFAQKGIKSFTPIAPVKTEEVVTAK